MAKVANDAVEATELLTELFHAHKRTMMVLARDHALTPQQAATLWALAPGQGIAMSALAEYLVCDASNVTGIVDKLEARGLAQREAGEDRRVKVLRLTPQGEALRAEMRRTLLDPPAWIRELPRDDQRLLREVLSRVVARMRGE
jgi:DNA-binding MarR family transcriptional regulator